MHLPDAPVFVTCDPVRTVQVLGNLVGNALKYSAPGTPVDVRLVEAGDSVRVEVSDVGRGIPADQVDRVFDKFHRVEDPMRMTTSGTGLGLYIARQLTTAMGGDLTCSSVLGVGSTFTLALNRATAGESSGDGGDAGAQAGSAHQGPGEEPAHPADRRRRQGAVVPMPRGRGGAGAFGRAGAPGGAARLAGPARAQETGGAALG